MMIITGMIVGWLKEFTFLGLAMIEALVLWFFYNQFVGCGLATIIQNATDFVVPITHLFYWNVYALIVLLHIVGIIVGRFIAAITPRFVKISNESKSE